MEMKHAVLVFPLTKTHVLLGMKKKDHGCGFWNGFGGKIQSGETKEDAAVRELHEESGLTVHTTDLEYVGAFQFHFNDIPHFYVHTFRTQNWQGEPIETDEMRPAWHRIDALPLAEMWEADREWVPRVLAGEHCWCNLFYRTTNSEQKDESVFERIEWHNTSPDSLKNA